MNITQHKFQYGRCSGRTLYYSVKNGVDITKVIEHANHKSKTWSTCVLTYPNGEQMFLTNSVRDE